MLIALVFAAAAAATPAPAAAPAPAPSPAVAAAATQPVKVVADKADPMVCEYIESTGSHVSDKQCMHKSEWDKLARDGGDDYQSFDRSMTHVGSTAGK